ncbi:MAG: acyl-CoA thioesterase [Bacteroidota bacterium]|jgi:acyl-CoA thioester hydrolase
MMMHETQIRVRYGETDQMGYVYYGNYALYYEMGRTEALRSLGLTYKGFEEIGIMMPVSSMNCKFIKAARYDDLLTIKTTIKSMPTVKMDFDYEITNEQGELVHTGQSTLVFIDMKTGRITRAPQQLIEKMEPYYNGQNKN